MPVTWLTVFPGSTKLLLRAPIDWSFIWIRLQVHKILFFFFLFFLLLFFGGEGGLVFGQWWPLHWALLPGGGTKCAPRAIATLCAQALMSCPSMPWYCFAIINDLFIFWQFYALACLDVHWCSHSNSTFLELLCPGTPWWRLLFHWINLTRVNSVEEPSP